MYIETLNQFIMKKIFLLATLGLFISCSNVQNPDYQANVEITKKWIEVFETQNFDLLTEIVSEDITATAPIYGMGQVGYDTYMNDIGKFYTDNFSNVKFNNPVFLPGVDNETLVPNGGVRIYGEWSGTSNESGKDFSVQAYHWFEFQDGKIVATGDYFDATGMLLAVAPDQD